MKHLVILFLLSALASPAFAKDHKHGKMGKGMMKGLMKELNLTDEQRSKMKELHMENKGGGKANREAIKKAKDALRNGWLENANDATMKSLHKAFHDAKMSGMNERFTKMLALRAILTDEQKAIFAKKMSERIDSGKRH
ncbi:MAG: hypothetical protein CL677_06415 [Bdellovibrionaceae bacterium]|nr:hypothetical protein [Pseudobdellovibrionaceae bacterium]|tara:strand:+ start:194 stop:610 length:417 start_codon:yes stop_codon:yes gene_type:complete